jgi:hypothetical protein
MSLGRRIHPPPAEGVRIENYVLLNSDSCPP